MSHVSHQVYTVCFSLYSNFLTTVSGTSNVLILVILVWLLASLPSSLSLKHFPSLSVCVSLPPPPPLSLSLSLPLCLCLSVFLVHILSSLMQTHTYTQSLSLSLSLSQSPTQCRHTHKHTPPNNLLCVCVLCFWQKSDLDDHC